MKKNTRNAIISSLIAVSLHNQTLLAMASASAVIKQSSGFIKLTIKVPRVIYIPSDFDLESEAPSSVDSSPFHPDITLAINPDEQEFLSKKTFAELLDNPNGTLLAVVNYHDTKRTVYILDEPIEITFDEEQVIYRVYEGTLLTKHLRRCDDKGELIYENLLLPEKINEYRYDPISSREILDVFYYVTPYAQHPFLYIGNDYMLDPCHLDSSLQALRAVNGDPKGQYKTAFHADVDQEAAVEWLQKAAAKGDSSSMYSLGYIYSTELPNDQKALEWYTKAAAEGHPHATLALAKLHDKNQDSKL